MRICPECEKAGASRPLSLDLEKGDFTCEAGHRYTTDEMTPVEDSRKKGKQNPKGKSRDELASQELATSNPKNDDFGPVFEPEIVAENTNDLSEAGDRPVTLFIREAYVEAIAQEAELQGKTVSEHMQGMMDYWMELEYTVRSR